jgi:hypothetical protein
MSTLGDVLDAVRRGVPAQSVAASLGIDSGLADLALDHWVRLDIITPAGNLHLGCGSCSGPAGEDQNQRAPGCAGCPFSR